MGREASDEAAANYSAIGVRSEKTLAVSGLGIGVSTNRAALQINGDRSARGAEATEVATNHRQTDKKPRRARVRYLENLSIRRIAFRFIYPKLRVGRRKAASTTSYPNL